MKEKIISIGLALSIALSGTSAFAGMYTEKADMSDWFVWQNPDFSQRQGSVTDASFLLDAPAGKHGFASAKGEDIYFEDGTRARFWGITVGRESVCPTVSQTDELVNRIAQSGYNLVRLHQFDTSEQFDLLFGDTDEKHVNKEQLDKMFYFIAELKKKGIYIYMDLLNKRNFKKALSQSHGNVGEAKYFDEEIINLQKEYAKEIFNTVNPYTGLTLADDPAVVFAQLVNEGGILNINKDSMSKYYIDEMHGLFNDWLTDKYKTTETLKTTWNESFTEGESLESKTVTFFGDGTKTLDELMATFNDTKKADVYGFLYNLTEKYYISMRDYLREIGVKCMLTGVGMGGGLKGSNQAKATVRINKEHMDFTDDHVYMSHPYSGMNMVSGTYASSYSMLYKPELFKALTDKRPYNQPFVISEWESCNINEYRAESLPMMAGYACFQNYTPIHFCLISGGVEANNINGYNSDTFSVYCDPVQTALAPMAAMIYLRHEVDEAEDEYYNTNTKENIIKNQEQFYDYDDSFRYMKRGIAFSDLPDYDAVKSDRTVFNKHKEKADKIVPKINDQMTYTSYDENANYLDWSVKDFHVFSINSAYTNMTVGFQNGEENKKDFGACTISYNNDFALVGITSITDEPLAESSRILMNTVARANSTGYDYTIKNGVIAIQNGGEAPMIAEPVEAQVVLKTTDDIKVYALDSNGCRTMEVPVNKTADGVEINVDGRYEALSYEIIRTGKAENFVNANFDKAEKCLKISGVVNNGGSIDVKVKKTNNGADVWNSAAECDEVGNFCVEVKDGVLWEDGNYTVEISQNREALAITEVSYVDLEKITVDAECKYSSDTEKAEIKGTVYRGAKPSKNAKVSIFVGKPGFKKASLADIGLGDVGAAYSMLLATTDENGYFSTAVEMSGANSGVYKVFVRADVKEFADIKTSDTKTFFVNHQSSMPIESVGDDGITTVVCIGDGLTKGQDSGSTNENPTYEYSYPNQLSSLLGDEYNVLNYGKDGATLCGGIFGYKGLLQFNQSMNVSDPEYLVIMFGTNDKSKFETDSGLEAFKAEYVYLIDMYRAKYKDAKFILISPPPLNTSEGAGGSVTNDTYYKDTASVIIKEIADETGCDFVNGYSLVKGSAQFEEQGFGIYYDSTHFTPDGYTIFADKVYEMIKADEKKVIVTADYTADGSLSMISDKNISSANIFLASYTSDGRLDKVTKFDMNDVDAYKSYIYPSESGFQKAFIWSADGKMNPITKPADIGSRFTQEGTKIIVSGKTFAGKTMPHAICVKDSSGNVAYAGQVKTNTDGSFTHTFNMPEDADAGDYTVLSGSYGDVISETFSYIK
jgi:lysophospholipase L1-like esterase